MQPILRSIPGAGLPLSAHLCPGGEWVDLSKCQDSAWQILCSLPLTPASPP
jgi:hypothetical protein